MPITRKLNEDDYDIPAIHELAAKMAHTLMLDYDLDINDGDAIDAAQIAREELQDEIASIISAS